MRPHGNNQEARQNKHVRNAPAKIAVKALGEEVLEDILDSTENPLILILDCIQDPHNLGAILRTADGAGVDAVIAPKDKSVGITETVLRVSVGAAEKVPFIQVTNLSRTMKMLQTRGIWIFGTSDKGDRDIYETDFSGGVALVMGAEGDGMRRLTEENCDFLIRIPMKGSVPCLNVSVATGVCLYEIVRQREQQ
ncbi:MAG: 23S rRNA (guanosine(2251)-2'-O)-methyltransferase RlmB [Akkermansia sp.]|nr:23S rRNA (guanosine(2251)-2'-O)-methyltransferase RlmB [Akkermansia sp.]